MSGFQKVPAAQPVCSVCGGPIRSVSAMYAGVITKHDYCEQPRDSIAAVMAVRGAEAAFELRSPWAVTNRTATR